MDQSTQLIALVVAAAVGLVAVVLIMRRQRHDVEDADPREPVRGEQRGHEALPELRGGEPGHRRELLELREAPARLGLQPRRPCRGRRARV